MQLPNLASGHLDETTVADRRGGGDVGDADVQVGQDLCDLLEREVKDLIGRVRQLMG